MGGSRNGSTNGSGHVNVTLAMGLTGGLGGDGGTVTVNTDNAQTTTSGVGAIGLLAQSIGGGGGAGGSSEVMASAANSSGSAAYAGGISLGGSGSGSGAGGDVTVQNAMGTIRWAPSPQPCWRSPSPAAAALHPGGQRHRQPRQQQPDAVSRRGPTASARTPER